MTIRRDQVHSINVGELLAKDLRIPSYQRPYAWKPSMAVQLFDDIVESLDRSSTVPDSTYVLGAVILHADDGTPGTFNVVDGQQRLLTLKMIEALLGGASLFTNGRDDSPVVVAWRALQLRRADLEVERTALLDHLRDQCEVVQIVTNSEDEAFRVFDSQNYRGKPLAPHDLLKAYHLRLMRNESIALQTAVVETWQSVSDAELDQLFATYLYRIARWTRGQPAPKFTVHDIGIFKGLAPSAQATPNGRYHLAAQVAVPMLDAWAARGIEGGERDRDRTRFQLDAPVPTGRGFFEMVAFMLEEVAKLREETFRDHWDPFAADDVFERGGRRVLVRRSSHQRYRKVSELYLAASLYYTNKFGGQGGRGAQARLFAWAYSVRVSHLRVQQATIDNRARGQHTDGSPFVLLRDASEGVAVHQLGASVNPYKERDEFEGPLVRLLRDLGA